MLAPEYLAAGVKWMRKSHLDVKSKSQKAMESSERAWVEGGGAQPRGTEEG